MKRKVSFDGQDSQSQHEAVINRTSPRSKKSKRFYQTLGAWRRSNDVILQAFSREQFQQWRQNYTKDCANGVMVIDQLRADEDVDAGTPGLFPELNRIAIRWRICNWIRVNQKNITSLSPILFQAFLQDDNLNWLIEIVSNQQLNDQQRADRLCHPSNYDRLARIAASLDVYTAQIRALPTLYNAFIPKVGEYLDGSNDFLMELLSNSLAGKFVDYVNANPACFNYLRMLHRELKKHAANQKEYCVLDALKNSSIDTTQLEYLLIAGLKTQRLEMLTYLWGYEGDEVLDALIFNETHRSCISDYFQSELSENAWQELPHPQQQLVDQYFTGLNGVLESPTAVDINRLWYAAGARILESDPVYRALATLKPSELSLSERRLYVSSFACAKKCFLDAIKDDEYSFADNGMLNVDPDILLWLFFRHTDNSEIVSYINNSKLRVEPIFANYGKEVSAHEGMLGVLLETTNSVIESEVKNAEHASADCAERAISAPFNLSSIK